MKKLFALLAALLLAFTAVPSLAAAETHRLHLDVTFDQNILMARYDVDLLINGEVVARLAHGQPLDITLPVRAGLCTVTFQKAEHPDVFVSTIVGVAGNTEVTCEIHANRKDLEFRSLHTNSAPSAYRLNEGDSLEIDGVAISVAGHRIQHSYGSSFPAEGKVYVVCQAEFTNNTPDDITVVALLSTLAFDACCDDVETDAIWTAMYGLSGDVTMAGLISTMERLTQNTEVIRPGKKNVIELVFEVPENWRVLEVYYAHDAIADGEVFFVVNND